jgi:ABC-type oligopeptide transport system ATPase subunit
MPVPDEAILQIEDLTTRFHLKRGTLTAVDHVSFRIKRGETLGLVGESGCGKSTTGKLLARLLEPTEGAVYLQGRNIWLIVSFDTDGEV